MLFIMLCWYYNKIIHNEKNPLDAMLIIIINELVITMAKISPVKENMNLQKVERLKK